MMNKDLMPMVADIVSAQILRTPTTHEELAKTIRLVYTTLSGLSQQGATPELGGAGRVSGPIPAVAIDKSIFPDYIICLEDGRKFKTLKRHLMASYNMSLEQYRARWNLPRTYPMTAPNYTLRRSEVARASGLGHKPGSSTRASVPAKRVKEGVSKKKGRPRKATA
jgi:predicted transcriptional regulator